MRVRLLALLALAACAPEKPADTAAPDTDTAAPDTDTAACVPAAEVPYDGVDQDCDGADLTDADGDGHAATEAGGDDCDDDDDDAFPGAEEACDGVDTDCDGTADPTTPWYRDDDGDGYGAGAFLRACEAPTGRVADDTDCDDTDAASFPGAPERCDGLDDDCDGEVPDDEADADGDGWSACEGDCDDADPVRRPDAFERCDGGDDDCDGAIDDACTACDRAVPEDHATIQEAIDAADTGDVVCVAPGTYLECVDFAGSAITLLGPAGAAATVIDADYDCGPVVLFAASEGPDSVLRGFTLTRGYGETGGGVTIADASPTIDAVVVEANGSVGVDGLGGGLYVYGGAPTITHLVARENGSRGGGYDGFGWGYGGGAYLEATDAVLDNVDVVDCGAGDAGGGLALIDTTASVTNVRVHSSNAEILGGGGVYVDGGAPTFTNLRLTENGVGSGFGYEPDGGGIYVTGDATPTFTNVLVSGSWSRDGTGAIYVDSGTPLFVNAVVTDSTGATAAVSGAATFRYSDVWGNTPADFADTDPTGTDGNLSVDPDLLGDDGHLAATSPLVDAGDPTLVDPDGSPADIGPFGGPGAAGWDLDGDGFPAWWLPGAYDAATSPGLDCEDADATVFPGAGC
jgi:hypothetical protein